MESILPRTLEELVHDAIDFGLSSEHIDVLIKVSGGNWIKRDRSTPFLKISFTDVKKFEKFINGNQVRFVMFGGVTRYIIIYSSKNVTDDDFPLARVYVMTIPDLLLFAKVGVYLKEKGIQSIPMSVEEFENEVGTNKYKLRIEKYCEKREKQNADFANITKGKSESTIVSKGVIFNSEGCYVCGNEALLITSTLSDLQDGMMFGFYLCSLHFEEAQKEGPLLNYLTTSFGGKPAFASKKISREFVAEAIVEFLKSQLHCTIHKKVLRETNNRGVLEDTIIANRKSGFTIIIRVSDDGSYAYMIKNNKGKEIVRIDNADHHKVQYGPSHIHLTPETDNKNVEASFTYGLPFIDIKIIRDVLDKHKG